MVHEYNYVSFPHVLYRPHCLCFLTSVLWCSEADCCGQLCRQVPYIAASNVPDVISTMDNEDFRIEILLESPYLGKMKNAGCIVLLGHGGATGHVPSVSQTCVLERN